MSKNKVFSKFYDTDNAQNKDKTKFRRRILKFLEDFVQIFYPADTNKLCRSELGITIKPVNGGRHGHDIIYHVEETFIDEDISVILDFITIVYDSVLPHKNSLSSIHEEKFNNYVNDINRILREESMCYTLNEDGRMRYYPDEEFHKSMTATIK